MPPTRPHPLVVIILDGWGISLVKEGNAIRAAHTPAMDHFAHHYPTASVAAAGIEVGLPWGEVGNSETGHRNIGAGRVQYQALPQIDKAISDGDFFDNPVLLRALEHTRQYNSQIHLMGLLGNGGVHAHSNHLFALLQFLARRNFRERVYIHAFTDGRDAPLKSGLAFVQQLEDMIGNYGVGKIASLTGRLYAMDRNENWDRTKATYDLLVGGPRLAGAASATAALEQAYANGIGDEDLPPTPITRGGGPLATIADNDAVIFFNFRPDRARQLTTAFVDPKFTHFTRSVKPHNLYVATMMQYAPDLPTEAVFTQTSVVMPLAQVLSEAHVRQLHIAETEKYAHVTYYLNGGTEVAFAGEQHVLIRSATVKNFAAQPHMAAGEITNYVLDAARKNLFGVYFVNFANADMVGHTGDFAAATEACAFIDRCLMRLFESVVLSGGALLITGDHGNAEEMLNLQTGAIEPDHTNNPVPLHYVHTQFEQHTPKTPQQLTAIFSQPIGVLSDVAPTILDILQLPKPLQMTGLSLLPSLQ